MRASASEHQMSVAFLREERHIIEEYIVAVKEIHFATTLPELYVSICSNR